MLKARIRSDYRWNSAQLLNGLEFIKSEFRPVPVGMEAEALGLADVLELSEAETADGVELAALETVEPETIAVEAAQPTSRKRKAKEE